ncbi:MAG: CPBP family intramembrane glutamic endopeptidase [Alphaproteobacteria bacterium]
MRTVYPFLERHQISLFTILTLLSSALIVAWAWQIEDYNITILVVLGPTVVAAILTAVFGGMSGLNDLFVKGIFRRFEFRWLVVAVLLVPAMGIVSVVLIFWNRGLEFELASTSLFPQIAFILLISVGEEFGWRGFLLPRLQERYSALISSLVLGLIWGVWHYPGHLIGVGSPEGIPFLVFMMWVLAMTILMTWVFNNTKSVLAAILMHSAANATFSYLPLLPDDRPTFYVLVGLAWVTVIALVTIWGPARLVRAK